MMSLSLSNYGVNRQDAEKFVLSILPDFGKHKGIKSHSDLTKNLDQVFATIASTAKARGSAEANAGSVTITHGDRWFSYGARQSEHWPFPFSGRICFYYCPDGVPNPPRPADPLDWDECYVICIEWWFP